MARDEAPPWELGQTAYNGGNIDINNVSSVNLEGKEYVFEDKYYGTSLYIRVRVVRNVSGVNIKPGYLCTFKTGFLHQRVDGLADTDMEYSFPSDPNLPPAGVPNNDCFYLITRGPTLVKTPLSAGAANVINQGDILVSLTAATSGATTAGRVTVQSGATTSGPGPVNNKIGRAMSAATTGNTNANLLVYIGD